MTEALDNMKLDRGIEQVMNAIRAGNRYLEKTAPWALAKQGDTKRLGTVMHTAAEALRICSGLLHPLMPGKMNELREALGYSPEEAGNINIAELKEWGKLKPGMKLKDTAGLFQRIQMEKSKEAPKKAEQKKKEAPKKEKEVGLITIDQFFETQLKTAKVLEADKVEGADKLLKLQIEIGEEKRQLIAGIAEFYKPEEVIGKTIVVVANLQPAKIRGVESQGMLLAAKKGKKLQLVTVDGEIPSGASVG
jgi:methionyl-tRNA synthetase